MMHACMYIYIYICIILLVKGWSILDHCDSDHTCITSIAFGSIYIYVWNWLTESLDSYIMQVSVIQKCIHFK